MSIEILVGMFSMSLIAWKFASYSVIKSPLPKNAGFAKLPVIVVVAAFFLAVILYGLIGGPGVTNLTPPSSGGTASTAVPATQASGDTKSGSVASLVGGLEERVKLDPENGKDWLLLAKSYDYLGRGADALEAYENAADLGVIDAALEAKLLGTDSQNTDPTGARIQGSVSLSPDAASSVKPSDTVFVIARDAEGSLVPIAVLKKLAGDLPFDFELSDKDSMVAGRGISSVEKVIVEAKLSATGDALNTNADIVAKSEAFDPTEPQQITLMLADADASGATSK